MIFDHEEIKAVCYLMQDGDDKNQILIGEEHLFVIHKAKTNKFLLQEIQKLKINQRKILLPIVFGGTLSTLSSVALFENLYPPIPVTFLLVSGLVLLYYGFMGELVLTVESKSTHADFTIEYVSDYLRNFMEFINPFFKESVKNEESWYLYLIFDSDGLQWDKLETPVKAYTKAQLAHEKMKFEKQKIKKVFVALNPFKLSGKVKFEKDAEHNLFPVIHGEINKDAIASQSDPER